MACDRLVRFCIVRDGQMRLGKSDLGILGVLIIQLSKLWKSLGVTDKLVFFCR